MIIKDFTAAVRKTVWAGLADHLDSGANLYAQEVRDKLGIQGPPRSLPGEPPHMDTQALIAGFGHQIDRANLIAVIGADVDYALDLELGRANMAPRPYIRGTLIEHANDIAKEIGRPL